MTNRDNLVEQVEILGEELDAANQRGEELEAELESLRDDAALGALVRRMPELGGVVSLIYTQKDEYPTENHQDETWRVWFGARSYSNTVGPCKSVEAALREALETSRTREKGDE